jgi:hypothetical protein
MSSSGTGKKAPPSRNRSDNTNNLADYDPAKFIVPASDSKGHSARKTFRLSLSHDREISNVVSSRLFPFLDDSDVLRWCVSYGLEALNTMQAIPYSVFGQAEAAMEVAREILYHKQYEQMFTVMDEAMEKVRQQGGMQEIRRLYARVQSAFEKMPEGYWRTHYLSTLRRKYLHLIDPAANRKRLEEEEAQRAPLRIGLAEDEEDVG